MPVPKDKYGIPIPGKKGFGKSPDYPGDYKKNFGFGGYEKTKDMFFDMMGYKDGSEYLNTLQKEKAEGMKIGKNVFIALLVIGFLL